MAINYDQGKEIWDILITFFPNPYGVAGLMGNLFAESSFNPKCVTGGGLKTKEQKLQYIRNVINGKIAPETFAHDGIAFGLAQWCYWSRKEDFFLYCRDHSFDIDDLFGQLNYLHYEIAKYKTVQKTLIMAESVKEASDIVMERYLKPANMSEQAKAKRLSFGQECYDLFAGDSDIPISWYKYVVTTAQNVNLRCGDGKNYAAVAQIKIKGTKLKWVATSESGWHAVESTAYNTKRVLWISPDFSELRSG